ncbi:SVEP1, partial [Symbiodinium microadriaticum]
MSSVDAVLLQFGLGAAALVLRYFSRPFVYCCQRCTACIWNCLCCLCVYKRRRTSASLLRRFLFTHAAVRWYWFHLAIQLGFLSREYQVISVASQGVWPSEVLLSYSALWLTYAVVFVEVCHFSSVRNKDVVTKITVDGLLDMLLLPVNIGFFGHLCVRKLALQLDGHSLHIISTIMESSEIWEAWALWSVLGLFVTVVDVESRRDPAHQEFAVPFRNLSLQGVRTWVFMIIIITATRLVMIGVLQSRAPTLCFWASKTCTSCNELYDQNIHLAAAAVNFILCSFALAFVFTFEHSFDQYLSKIGPFWKFWGVKGVVSVTYFQWLVLTYGPLNLDDKRIYELHCLLCTVEMPILAVLHATCAYPYGKPWLNYLLQLQQQDMSEQEAMTERTSRFRFTEFNVDFTISTRSCGPETWVLLFYVLFWSLGCFASHRFVVFLLPVAHEVQGPQPPIYYATCNAEGDIAHFLAGSQLHFQIRNDTVEKHRLPGVAGAWLPLCGKAALDCEPGFHGAPALRCSPRGKYEPTGLCKPIRCGQPGEEVGHARLHKSDLVIREWTSDMVISYECIRGFVGKIRAKCGKEGHWTFTGECTEVLCPDPPTVARAKPLLEPSELQNRTWQAGMSLRYQCIDPFVGIITARCEDDGNFVLHGRCLAFCKTPPAVPNAIADYNNSVAGIGWSEGMRVKYDCSPGWSGTVFATCREDGQYSIEGSCKAQCPDLNKILHDTYGASWADVISVNRSHSLDLTGSGEADIVALACAPGLTGLPFAACQEGSWQAYIGQEYDKLPAVAP